MAVATESARALVRGLESIRKIQERAVHDVLHRHQAALGKLDGHLQPADLMNLQSDLLQSDLQDAARCLQELAGAALEMQTEIASCGSHLIDTESVLEAASAVKALPVVGMDTVLGRKPAARRRGRAA
jgi:hypothetical protein